MGIVRRQKGNIMDKIHVFEAAGLGKAPFQYLGYYEDRGGRQMQTATGLTVTVGAPGQPMGTCDYCGASIAICCRIQSSDGKTFVVGSDCVMKTDDHGLKSKVNEIKSELNRARQDAAIADNLAWVEANREILSTIPHGKYSMLDSIEWFYKNAGRSGKIRIVKIARAAIAKAEGN